MSEQPLRFVVDQPGLRVDRLVADATGRGRRAVRELLLAGSVRVDGRIARASDTAAAGSEIVVEITLTRDAWREKEDEATREDPAPGAKPFLNIVVETDCCVVLAKPAGLHCERGRSTKSLAAMLDRHFGLAEVGDRPAEAGLVHRLDRDTSGVVVAARWRADYLRLRRAFRRGETSKQYLALAAGSLRRATDLSMPLARRRGRMAIAGPHDDGLAAVTRLEPLDGGRNWTLLLATMSTGAMHQVRVHAAAAGHPLLGDALYGGPLLADATRQGQLLHALRVRIAGELDVSSGPPQDFLTAYARLRRDGL